MQVRVEEYCHCTRDGDELIIGEKYLIKQFTVYYVGFYNNCHIFENINHSSSIKFSSKFVPKEYIEKGNGTYWYLENVIFPIFQHEITLYKE